MVCAMTENQSNQGFAGELGPLTQEDIDGCRGSLRQARLSLEQCAQALTPRFDLSRNAYQELVTLYHDGSLDDGGLGSDWLFAYEWYQGWVEPKPNKRLPRGA